MSNIGTTCRPGYLGYGRANKKIKCGNSMIKSQRVQFIFISDSGVK
jgi:hypothetical protein